MATILVTGGTGFIGSYIAQEFVNEGHEVVAFDLSTDTRILEKLGVESEVTVRRGDVSDPTDVLRAIRETGATHIVHLAALLTTSARENPRLTHEVNIGGTNTVFEAARILDDQIERIAWASSAAVFAPPANYDDWVTEDDLVYPDTLYGATKEYNEHQARIYYEDFDISHVGLRPTVAYGPYRETGGSAFLANIIEKPALGEPFSVEYGDQIIDWQHVKDIAQAFRLATLTPDNQLSQRIYNVRGEIATIRKASETVQSILPDAELTVTDEGELPWTQQLDMSAIQEDMDYEVQYDLERGFREYINVLREENGLETI
jgi:UDP-glucose 4-epimerase